MKKLLDRLKGNGNTTAGGETDPSEDSRFFTTMFMERADESLITVPWRERAESIGAEKADPIKGAQQLKQVWGADRYVAALGDQQVARLADFFEFVTVPPNKELIGQDEQGDYMLIVLEGLVAVDRIQPWGGRARLAEARPGDMLGEMSLLDAGARFSACTSLKTSTLAVLSAQRLDDLVQEEPQLGLALLASLARRLSLRLRQVSARLSALLSQG